jgi:site-specific DNA-methyltransferase (adenine-specific)
VVQADEKKGVPLSDVWDIPFLNPKAKERTGYPTQKPIELLERIIKISTDENDLVLDPFMGSGTTLVSAKLLNRRYIGIDRNKDAFDIAQNRLENPFKTKSNLLEKALLQRIVDPAANRETG